MSLAYGHAGARFQIAAISPSNYTARNIHHWNRLLLRNINICVLILIGFFSLPQTAWPREWRFDDVDRVVAMADVHGAYDAMVATLQNADVLGADLAWIGEKTNLVIVGDILDRGPKSRAAMDLLMRLEGEALAAGGRVHVLIGNHESMILTGDMRYVSKPEYAAFAEDEDPQERARWFDLYVERQGADADTVRDEFDQTYPPGYFAMRSAFRPDGRYGEWLLQKNIIAVINGTAFVHGGLSPDVAHIGLDGVNQVLQKELVEFTAVLDLLTDSEILLPTDSHYKYEIILNNYMPALSEDPAILHAIDAGVRLSNSEILGVDGPLWYRSNVRCPGIIEEHRLDAALAAIGADRVVVGHTPTPNRKVLQRFDGRLIEIDTGMLNFYYSGIGHALVLDGDLVSVMNQNGVDSHVPMDHPRAVGRRAAGLTAQKLQTLLETGEIVAVNKATPSIVNTVPRTEVRISDGEHTVNAIFDKRKGKGFYPGVAAYRMDRLLELDMVPVTVKRAVKGREGSLQFLPDNTTDESVRKSSGQGGNSSCPIMDQWAAMYVFDVLIFNEGRTQQRMMYDKSTWSLILSEHDRAFANRKGRPGHLENAGLTVSAGWKNALSEMTDQVLQEEFGDVIDKRRLKALAARRDELIAKRPVPKRRPK